jgi:hypothetical protein
MDAQVLKALQAIAQSARPHFWPQNLVEYSQLLLVLLTGATLVALVLYTLETVKLRRATQAQVDVTHRLLKEAQNQVKESQSQNEYALMPVVVLTTTRHPGVCDAIFALRNNGNGPAFNAATRPIVCGDARKPFRLWHGATIAAGEGEPAQLSWDPLSKRLEASDFAIWLRDKGGETAVQTSIVYQSVTGRWYETSHTITLASGRNDLNIHFDSFRHLEEAPAWVQSGAVQS